MTSAPTRRHLILALAAMLVAGAHPAFSGQSGASAGKTTDTVKRAATGSTTVKVAKSATCGCCNGWVEHMRKNGYTVETENVSAAELSRLKRQLGIAPNLASCHTANVGGYTIEGHVPAADVQKLLAEAPDAVGLAVPGMPTGSPGMEYGSRRDAYDVLLVKRDGSTSVFRHYDAKD